MAERYSDPLVTITDDSIVIHRYYFPTGDKEIFWDEIEQVRALRPTMWNGKWRLHGTGTLSTWFACDFGRPAREAIFIMRLRSQDVKVGFTVHDSPRVKRIFAERFLLVDEQGDAPPAPLPADSPRLRAFGLGVMLMLTAFMVGEAAYYGGQLPPRVATHFGANGAADGWGPRALLITATIGAVLLNAVLFGGLGILMARTAARFAATPIVWLGAGTVAMLAAIMHLTLRANLLPHPSLGTAPWYIFGGWLSFIVLIALAMTALSRHAARTTDARA